MAKYYNKVFVNEFPFRLKMHKQGVKSMRHLRVMKMKVMMYNLVKTNNKRTHLKLITKNLKKLSQKLKLFWKL